MSDDPGGMRQTCAGLPHPCMCLMCTEGFQSGHWRASFGLYHKVQKPISSSSHRPLSSCRPERSQHLFKRLVIHPVTKSVAAIASCLVPHTPPQAPDSLVLLEQGAALVWKDQGAWTSKTTSLAPRTAGPRPQILSRACLAHLSSASNDYQLGYMVMCMRGASWCSGIMTHRNPGKNSRSYKQHGACEPDLSGARRGSGLLGSSCGQLLLRQLLWQAPGSSPLPLVLLCPATTQLSGGPRVLGILGVHRKGGKFSLLAAQGRGQAAAPALLPEQRPAEPAS